MLTSRGRAALAARLTAGVIAAAGAAFAPPARADDGVVAPAAPAAPAPHHSFTDHWSEAPARPFIAGVADAGALVRAKLQLGYGKPHWTWAGLELDGISTTEFGATAVRGRLSLVVLDVAVAWRHTWAYDRTFVPEQDRHTSDELTRGPAASYDSVDLWAWGLAPAPAGYIDWELEALRIRGVPAGHEVYEEWFRAVIRPRWTTTARLAYAVTFAGDRGSAGAMGEWVWLGGRGSVFRVGPLATWAFSPHWDVGLVLTAVVSSPDTLDFYDGLWGTLRFQYRFAA